MGGGGKWGRAAALADAALPPVGMNFRIHPREAALLVIDMQNAFCHPDGTLARSGADVSMCRAIVPRVAELVGTCRAAGIPDIWTLQEHFVDDRGRAAHRIAPHTARRKGVAAARGTWDAELVDELKPLLDERSHVIRKHRFGVFYGTRLEVLLRALGARTLIVTGTTTNACVDTSIREAYMRDYDLVIVEDCIGGLDPELHRAAVKVWTFYMGLVVKAADLPGLISTEGG